MFTAPNDIYMAYWTMDYVAFVDVQDELNLICSLYDICFRQDDDDQHTADR